MLCNNPECVLLRRSLQEAWERILKLDDEIQRISALVRQIEGEDAPQANL